VISGCAARCAERRRRCEKIVGKPKQSHAKTQSRKANKGVLAFAPLRDDFSFFHSFAGFPHFDKLKAVSEVERHIKRRSRCSHYTRPRTGGVAPASIKNHTARKQEFQDCNESSALVSIPAASDGGQMLLT